MVYPYGISQNPYPSSPTPTLMDAKVLGGRRHKDAREAVIGCIRELSSKAATKTEASEKDFRLVTVIQDVGAGKTHLALHVKSTQQNIVCSYLDLSTISPKNLQSLYASLIAGFSDAYVAELKAAFIEHIKKNAANGDRSARKFFRPPIFGGKSLDELAKQVLDGKEPDIRALNEVLVGEFNVDERRVIKSVIFNGFRDTSRVTSLEDMLAQLTAIARLNHKFLGRITMLELDELDADKDGVDFVKAIINAHLPSTIFLLITTPSLYDQIRNANASIFDRLEKANYKIDLAGSSTFDEISDIVLEYIRQNVKDPRYVEAYAGNLISRIRVIFDEFQEFRNIRSMLNIMYHAMEIASRGNNTELTEDALEETIGHAYPGLRVRGSIMNVPISEFIRIRRECGEGPRLESSVKDAIRSLVMFGHEQGMVSKPEHSGGQAEGAGLETMYSDTNGSRTGVVVVINKDHGKSIGMISQADGHNVDRLLVLTNASTPSSDNATVVTIDKPKMIDLIYFSQKYKNEDIAGTDSERALMLAKSMLLY